MTDGPSAAQPGQERLAAVQQDLLQALERTQRESEQAADASQALDRISGRASSQDQAITVVVNAGGAPREISFTEKIDKRSPAELAAELMACFQRAQATLAEEFTQQAGDNPFAGRIAQKFQERFPPPEPDPGTEQVNEARIGELAEQESAQAPAEPPAAARRPRYEEDEEDFGDTNFLQEPDSGRGSDHA
ncbi:hypothetical protein GCM10022222_27580 [Amycolatopsis ultiminotia]|uniref:YbaB/EbfC DNA-binding family protein n=1 Tax=Amycolatopsis ultiminotia TaxID=543629 RepID=A0ABP6VW18_9PSEU